MSLMKTTEKMKNNSTLNILLLVAAGSSSRMGGKCKKEHLSLNGGTVLSNGAAVFLRTIPFDIVCVTYPDSSDAKQLDNNLKACKEALVQDDFNQAIKTFNKDTQLLFVPGGSSRQKSVYNALYAINEKTKSQDSRKVVFIHDGARPFVTAQIIIDAYNTCLEHGAAVPALEPVDTQKEIDSNGFIIRHLNRSSLAAVQTPQVFIFDEIFKAHQKALLSDTEFTDDTAIWDEYVTDYSKCKIVKGDSINKKITYPQDIAPQGTPMIRTGLGYDKHLLIEGRKLMLGGVEIPSPKGEAGHSDGDALLHAVTDALLGASGMGDIGSYFPSEDPQWKDADSAILLSRVWADITAKGWQLENIDCVVELQSPKFLPHRQNVIKRIASILNVSEDRIFVKAKTGEKTGEIGLGQAVECFATCLLFRHFQN